MKIKLNLKINGQLLTMMAEKNHLHYAKIILILFILPFPIMVWGVMTQGWWFPIMASMFLAFTIVIMLMVALGKDGLGESGRRCICRRCIKFGRGITNHWFWHVVSI